MNQTIIGWHFSTDNDNAIGSGSSVMRQKYIAIVSLPYTEYSCKMASLLFDIVGAPSALCGSAHFSSDRALPHSTATFRRRKSNGARVSKMDQAYKRCCGLGDARSEAPWPEPAEHLEAKRLLTIQLEIL